MAVLGPAVSHRTFLQQAGPAGQGHIPAKLPVHKVEKVHKVPAVVKVRIVQVAVIVVVGLNDALVPAVGKRKIPVAAVLRGGAAVVSGIADQRQVRKFFPRDLQPALHQAALLPHNVVGVVGQVKIHLVVQRDQEQRRTVAVAAVQLPQLGFPNFQRAGAGDMVDHQPRPGAFQRNHHARMVRRVQPHIGPGRAVGAGGHDVVLQGQLHIGPGQGAVVGAHVGGHMVAAPHPQRPAVIQQGAAVKRHGAEPHRFAPGVHRFALAVQAQRQPVQVGRARPPQPRRDLRRAEADGACFAAVQRKGAGLAGAERFAGDGMYQFVFQLCRAGRRAGVGQCDPDVRVRQGRAEPDIGDAQPVRDAQPDAAPDAARMVAVKAVGQVVGAERPVLARRGRRHGGRSLARLDVKVVDGTGAAGRRVGQFAADLHGNDVAAGMDAAADIHLHGGEHADVLVHLDAVAINGADQGDALKVQADAFVFDPLRQVDAVAVPGPAGGLTVKGVVPAAGKFLQPVIVALALVHPVRAHGLAFQPGLQRNPGFRHMDGVGAGVVVAGRRRVAPDLAVGDEQPAAFQRKLQPVVRQAGHRKRAVERPVAAALLLPALRRQGDKVQKAGLLHRPLQGVRRGRLYRYVLVLRFHKAAAQRDAASAEGGARIGAQDAGLGLAVQVDRNAAARADHPQPVPHPRHGRLFQRAQGQHFVASHRAQPGQVQMLVAAAPQAHHVAVLPVMVAETGPDIHLGRGLRRAGRKAQVHIRHRRALVGRPAVLRGQHTVRKAAVFAAAVHRPLSAPQRPPAGVRAFVFHCRSLLSVSAAVTAPPPGRPAAGSPPAAPARTKGRSAGPAQSR